MKRIILIDNHDSFTGNLFQLFDENPSCSIDVVSVSNVVVEDLDLYDGLVISPGPDVPSAYPQLFEILAKYSSSKSILGVCLGHQTLVEFFGGKLYNLAHVAHGKQENIRVDPHQKLFSNLNPIQEVGLYHSWAADPHFLPECLRVTAQTNSGTIMAFEHKTLDCMGIQFHPESYMTTYGKEMIDNWLK